MYFSTIHVRDIIVHDITVHSIMLCYPIIVNFSNIKENTPTYTLTSTCTHMYTRDLALSQPKQDREALSFSQHWDLFLFYYNIFILGKPITTRWVNQLQPGGLGHSPTF